MALPAQLLRVDGLNRASVITGPAAVAEALVEAREGVEPDGRTGIPFIEISGGRDPLGYLMMHDNPRIDNIICTYSISRYDVPRGSGPFEKSIESTI
jgi:hypothetical protein